MVPIAVDTGGSAPTGRQVISPVALFAHPAGIFCAPPYRARPHPTYLAARLQPVLVLIITMGRVVAVTSRRYAE